MTNELPDPLVPAEVDLSDFDYTPVFRVRLFNSTFHARATDAEWRAGFTLWLKSWDQHPSGSLPDDDIDLCRLAELARDLRGWAKVKPMALHGWVKCSDGRLHHPVVAEVVLAAWGKRSSASKKGKLGATIRWLKHQKEMAEASPNDGASTNQLMPNDSNKKLKLNRSGSEELQSQTLLSGIGPPDASPPTIEKANGHRSAARELLEFLNDKTGRSYEPVEANLGPIVARLKEGTTPDDVRSVIAKKCREWGTDERMAQYLRPKTLFNATNFANYKGELKP